ncbi:uncharacterized protein LOC129599312 isoform X2 [Paramacrobiotus metropolitanus]|uniref:uncharacterized protein LOC129599312 isoform X2 n=1 Tax=Paramacrobiotus metropolitanus TaxID=2943436 RepID=UPI002445A660|nr:uncharacterized protein LOC129599312 isoform X2 [Paramacrobiotus metropolitanus]XP_055353500.1 uncharacterized protein LOC129599312 isoform X2 [Paramacrobiotus metropolitanus]
MERIVEDATRNTASEKIHLVFQRPAPSAGRGILQVIRVDSGGDASFPCAVHNLTYNAPLQLPDIFWTHQQLALAFFSNGRLLSEGKFDLQYSVHSRPSPAFAYANVIMILTFKNVSWKISGDVACSEVCRLNPAIVFEPPHTGMVGDATFCDRNKQNFRLLVFPSASELFPVPLANVSLRRGEDAHIGCVANRLNAATLSAFIWRFNGRVIAAPVDHPLRALVSLVVDPRGGRVPPEQFPLYGISAARDFTFAVSFNITETTIISTLVISDVDLHTSARVECWVRPDDSQEVWRRQIAYLHVVSTPAA